MSDGISTPGSYSSTTFSLPSTPKNGARAETSTRVDDGDPPLDLLRVPF